MSDAIPLPPRPRLEQYRKIARDLQRACASGDPGAIDRWGAKALSAIARLRGERDGNTSALNRAAQRLTRRWQEFRRTSDRGDRCLLADAQFFIAREHGFASWPKFAAHVEALSGQTPVARFEAAADAIVAGDITTLRALLRDHPELVAARSTRDHGSTLLHYVSANGVEDFRQITPPNIVEIARLLLDRGADVNAESAAYGGGSTTLGLAATSIHPEQAGVQTALLELLLARGADIEKPGLTGNQHSAVWGCLANGQGGAARLFADRGARMNLAEAAGVGRLDVVRTFFDEHGRLRDASLQRQMEEGFLYACGYGRLDTARYLLDRGVNPGVCDDAGQTPLHWTSYGPHVEVAALLLERGAPIDPRDHRFNATPLEWALRAAAATDHADRERAYQLVALLSRAGAALEIDRLGEDAARRIEEDERLQRALKGI
ncbi:MAG TPA: ankyrin repeat domain-containing protein [Vicinamibacterales bacterium]|nr:ankyrin repeat domain-containing protein [Vicinamibacterales bacterium]